MLQDIRYLVDRQRFAFQHLTDISAAALTSLGLALIVNIIESHDQWRHM
jgi:hypothetical protein